MVFAGAPDLALTGGFVFKVLALARMGCRCIAPEVHRKITAVSSPLISCKSILLLTFVAPQRLSKCLTRFSKGQFVTGGFSKSKGAAGAVDVVLCRHFWSHRYAVVETIKIAISTKKKRLMASC